MGKATLLDLYSGCGGMSTGLCLGAALAGLNLETVLFFPHSSGRTFAISVLNPFFFCYVASDGLLISIVLRARVSSIIIQELRYVVNCIDLFVFSVVL